MISVIEPIWTRPELKGGGYSAAMVYECEDFYVSLGYARGNPIALFVFGMGVTIVGSDDELAAWKRQKNGGAKQKFAFFLLLKHLDADKLKALLRNEYERGAKDGRNEIRGKLGELMAEEL